MVHTTDTRKFDAAELWMDIYRIRKSKPLVLNITNYVVANTTANALLALGASPIMSFAKEEAEELVDLASAVVINTGTLNMKDSETMSAAWFAADKIKRPVVFDPVGIGASRFRANTILSLLSKHRPTIIRGNASEIMTLAGKSGKSRGVDSTQSSTTAILGAKALSQVYGSIVCASGEHDIISNETDVFRISGGHEMMPFVTGLGCTSTALCAAFLAVNDDPFAATVHAMGTMAIAGAMAAEKSDGPGSLQLNLYDALYAMAESDVESRFDVAQT